MSFQKANNAYFSIGRDILPKIQCRQMGRLHASQDSAHPFSRDARKEQTFSLWRALSKLSFGPAPWRADDLDELRSAGIEVVITLLADDERQEMFPDLGAEWRARGGTW